MSVIFRSSVLLTNTLTLKDYGTGTALEPLTSCRHDSIAEFKSEVFLHELERVLESLGDVVYNISLEDRAPQNQL